METVLLTGGTGMIGTQLQKHLLKNNYSVIILDRGAAKNKSSNQNITFAKWNIEKGEIDNDAISNSDYIVHLAGANVAEKRWTEKRKKEIVESRTKSDELVVNSLKEIPNKVKAVISASAIGWYGADTKQSIQNGFKEAETAAKDFLGETCRLWEAGIKPVEQLYKRLTILRFGVVLSNEGGALPQFKKPLKFAVAGILGNGRQVISWIHVDDLCRLILMTIENAGMHGVYNAVAPQTITNKAFTLQLARQIRGKIFVPMHVPAFALKLIMGEMSTEVLKSATVNDDKIKIAGFKFLYPDVEVALKDLAG